jgi:hypothetical protein
MTNYKQDAPPEQAMSFIVLAVNFLPMDSKAQKGKFLIWLDKMGYCSFFLVELVYQD